MIASAVSTNFIQQAILERKRPNVATLLKVTLDKRGPNYNSIFNVYLFFFSFGTCFKRFSKTLLTLSAMGVFFYPYFKVL